MLRDPEFGPTRIRAFGTYTVKVADAGRFMTEIVGTDGEFTTDEITFQIRNVIVQEFSRVGRGIRHPGARHGRQHGPSSASWWPPASPETIAQYGLTLPELYIENISLPPAVETGARTSGTSMGVVGDLNKYTQYSAAEAMQSAASASGDGGTMGRGPRCRPRHGDGQHDDGCRPVPGARRRTSRTSRPPAPPPLRRRLSKTMSGTSPRTARRGAPFPRPISAAWPPQGNSRAETHVWTAGQDGWMQAEDP